VRDVLHRETYRGVVIWNKSKQRDAEGQQRQHDRPAAEWVTIPAEYLRIVPESLWHAVHDRLREKHATAATAAPPTLVGRGIRRKYFLAGFGRCSECGGSMQAVSRPGTDGRRFRYMCGTYWNRGASVCSNGMMAEMPTTDQAIRDLLRGEVLRPRVVEGGDRPDDHDVATGDAGRVDGRLTTQLATLDRELANLAETAARGGAVPAVLALLAERDQERRRVAADLEQAQRVWACHVVTPQAIQARLRGFLRDWDDLLGGTDTVKARGVLDAALVDRIRFAPVVDEHRYRLTMPIAFDRLLIAAVPEFAGFTRNVGVPRGIRDKVESTIFSGVAA
jgi:hypothetical protein